MTESAHTRAASPGQPPAAAGAAGSSRRLRIAHLGGKGLPSRGGTERVIEAVATAQAAEHDVTVYGSRRVCESGEFRGVRVVALPVPRGKYLGPVWLDLAAAAHVLATGGADVVHIHGAENTFVARLLRRYAAVVTTNHGPAHERAKWGALAKAVIRGTERGSVVGADAATAVARSQADALSSRHGAEVRHVPNGVDAGLAPDREGAACILRANGLQPGGYAMFAAARVDPTKGCLTLLQAWRDLGEPLPLLVVGDLWHAPGHEEELRLAAEGMSVRFLPRVEDRRVLAGLASAARAFVFPSTVEAMSMMLLESIALEVPVIASDIVENLDVLPDDAWTFRAGDAGDLARAWREFEAQPAEQVRARCAGRASATSERYGWERIRQEYDVVYEAALAGRRTRAGRGRVARPHAEWKDHRR